MKHFMFGKLKTVIWRVTEVITLNDISEKKTRLKTSIDMQREREKEKERKGEGEVIEGFCEKKNNLAYTKKWHKKVIQKG